MDFKMNIISWNINGISSKTYEVPINLAECDVLCISETKLQPTSRYKPNFKGFNCVRQDRPNGKGGGLIIFINQGIKYSRIPINFAPDGVEVIGVKLIYNNEPIHLFSLYIPPRVRLDNRKAEFSSFMVKLSNYGSAIITGDFNAHHPYWGSGLWNPRGELLADIIIDLSLNVLNTGDATRLHFEVEKNSVPDVSLCTNDSSIFMNWHTIKDLMKSDHYPMKMILDKGRLNRSFVSGRIGTNKVDWNKFRTNLSEKIQNRPGLNGSNFLEEYSHMVQAMKESLDNAGARMVSGGKKDNTSKGPPPSPWWDKECSEAVDKRRKALKTYVNSASDVNFAIYEEVASATSKLLRRKKEIGQDFCKSLNPSMGLNLLWKTIKGFKNRVLQPQVTSRDSNITNNDPLLKEAFNKLTKNHVQPRTLPN